VGRGSRLDDFHECPCCFSKRTLDAFNGKDPVCKYCRSKEGRASSLSFALMAVHTDISPVDQVFSRGEMAGMMSALRIAHREGRLDPSWARELMVDTGQYECQYCGMRAWTDAEAMGCCAPWFLNYETRRGL